jgi:hypothetical protein
MGVAVSVGPKPGVNRKRRRVDLMTQFAELPVVADSEKNRRGRSAISIVRRDVGMGVPGALRRLAGEKEIREMRMQQRNSTIVQRRIDELPFPAAAAFVEREQYPYRRIETRRDVHHRHTDAEGIASRLAVDAHEPRHRLNHGARLFRKSSNRASMLCYQGHVLMENRSSLVVSAVVTFAGGTGERIAALAMLDTTAGANARRRQSLRHGGLHCRVPSTRGDAPFSVQRRSSRGAVPLTRAQRAIPATR